MTFSNNATLALNTNANYSLTLTGLHGGGTIALAGTNNVAVTVTGVVSPSDPQKLNVNNLAFGSGGTNNTYTAVIVTGSGSNSAGAGTNYDQINVTGAAALNVNGATLNIMDPTYTPAAGDEFFLVNESATSTAFGQVEFNGSLVAPDGSGNYDIGTAIYSLSYTGNEVTGATTGGHDVVLDVVSVPEPTVLGLFALGGMGLLARRRRRTTQRN